MVPKYSLVCASLNRIYSVHDPPLPLRGWWTVLGFEWIQFANGAKGEIFMNTIQDSDREREKERLKGNIHEGRP